jgi:4-hydroxy-tetrahydrodipicolinate synthase
MGESRVRPHLSVAETPLFTGLSAFPLTPASDAGIVDTETLARLVARLVGAGVASIGVLGSTGTFMYLSRSERRRAIAAVEASGGLPVIAGVGALRTDAAVNFARDAAACGASGVLLAPVSYIPLTDDEVLAHAAAVAAAAALPVCFYNNPATTHFSVSPALLGRLARLPNVHAVKMPLPANGDVAAEFALLRAQTGADFKIGYSGDPGLCSAMCARADGFYSALAGILPMETLRLYRAAAVGDGGHAAAQDQALQPLWTLFRAHGGLRVIYAIADVLDLPVGLPPRPILPLPPETCAAVRAAITGLLSSPPPAAMSPRM